METSKIDIKRKENGDIVRIDAVAKIFITKKSRNWVIVSPDFKTIGFSSESEVKAIEDFQRALNLFFDVHVKRGTLFQALTNFGWDFTGNKLIPRKLSNTSKILPPKTKAVEQHYALTA